MKNIVIKLIFLFISLFTLLISAPIADAGEDFNVCRVCWDLNSSIFDGAYAIQLNGNDSYDEDSLELSYSWQKPDNFLMINSSTSSPKIRFDYDNPDYSINDLDISLEYDFILTVSNGTSEDKDTVSIAFEMSAPLVPTVYSKSDSGKVVLTWTSDPEN